MRLLASENNCIYNQDDAPVIDRVAQKIDIRSETMHIPDGYLSPSTCAALYAASAPFWYIALQRIKRLLHSRLVPLISVFAAFSFVIMMFNLPLPGGTTGHAIGVGIAAIVLGPWGAMLGISVALIIQALFFGDGGITAIGANCFNMAIIGSLVAHSTYRLIAGRTPLESPRRIIAAAIAGYAAINIAALLAAIEFGIQPLLFTDSTGAPLYAFYPLNVAIPAMMIGHLTFAGLAELIISGGVVAYLQRSDPELLKLTAGAETNLPQRNGWRATRTLWAGLALLMLLTPLGLLAAGTAWGEWSVADLQDPQARTHIVSASGQPIPLPQAPQGLAQLSNLWTAPIPDYAPPFMHSPQFGYIMSALFGTGLIILAILLLTTLAHLLRHRRDEKSPTTHPRTS